MAINATLTKNRLYSIAFERRKKLYQGQFQREIKTLKTPDGNRLIIGLGNPSVLETGLALHHTYGTPVIPGSALKGLCAHHARDLFFKRGSKNEQWLEEKPELMTEAQYTFIFGGQKNQGHISNQKSQGHIIFFDAWIVPESKPLKQDVMTPHHLDYYSQKGESPPTDFDSPTPVSFLSVSGTFEIILGTISAEVDKVWLDIVWEILQDALKTRGIGGKTSSGYGRMIEVPLGN